MFDIITNAVIVAYFLWLSKTYRYGGFFVVALLGIVATIISILAYGQEKEIIHFSSLIRTLLFAGASWYLWRKFQDRLYFYFGLMEFVYVIGKIYSYYIEKNLFDHGSLSLLYSLFATILIEETLAVFFIYKLLLLYLPRSAAMFIFLLLLLSELFLTLHLVNLIYS